MPGPHRACGQDAVGRGGAGPDPVPDYAEAGAGAGVEEVGSRGLAVGGGAGRRSRNSLARPKAWDRYPEAVDLLVGGEGGDGDGGLCGGGEIGRAHV